MLRVVPLYTLLLAGAACAPPRTPALPTGSGTPFPGFAAAYDQAVNECRNARTLVTELGLSGRAGDTRLRGRITAGFAAPSSVRLEGVALGRPIFILVSQDDDATLLLPRENRIVRGAAPEAIVEALAGVALTPGELRAAVAGCGLGAGTPANGRTLSDNWAAVDLDGEPTYLRRVDGRWRIGGAMRGPVRIVYADFAGGLPATIHIRSGAPQAAEAARAVADITLRVSQLEINTAIDPRAFELQIPPDAVPLSIEELRDAGPLGDRGQNGARPAADTGQMPR